MYATVGYLHLFALWQSHEGLDGLLILPEMSQDQVKRLSTLVAAHMSMCLDAACGDLGMPPMTLSQKKSARHGKSGSGNPASGCHPTCV